ncbi:MAG: carbohydrate binding domain-containing protein, partial [Acidothermus sp.]|nr:carbohydrate binding domain-containing protein [Acidothermus sp.]
MSRHRSVVAAAVASAATALAAVLVGLPAQAATNLIANPGFESGTLSPWSGSACAVVRSPVHAGSYALAGAASSSDNAQCQQVVSVSPGTTYSLSAYVNGNYVYLGVSGTGTTDVSTWTPTTNGAFTALSVTFTTGAATTSVTVWVHGWYGQGTYYADDFSLPGTGSEPTPSSSPAPTQSPTPSSTPTATPTPTPTPTASSSPTPTPPASGLPAHVLTGYWQDFVNGATPLRLRDVPSSYDLIAVAFADATSTPGAVSFAIDSGLSSALGGYSATDFISDINYLHSLGKHVIISVGGQNGTVSVSDSSSATNFANSVYQLMRQYGFDGVDIDLENGINATYMTQALRQLSSLAGPSLIITMAPQTIDMQSTGMAYFQLALNIKDILTIVNTQYYNSGSMNGCDGKVYAQGSEDFLTALACIQLQGGLRPDQVGLGLPATTSAAGGGYVSPSVVNNALDCLAIGSNCATFHPPTTWPGIRGAMTWSINWDATSGYAFANTVAPHLRTLPTSS